MQTDSEILLNSNLLSNFVKKILLKGYYFRMKKYTYKINKNILQIFYVRTFFSIFFFYQLIAYLTAIILTKLDKSPKLNNFET